MENFEQGWMYSSLQWYLKAEDRIVVIADVPAGQVRNLPSPER